ncbi:TlpA family protein disulfide reductase [Blastopirellula marina]|uniref:Thioredoxin domain-containing protein n=1 Tax=Blastopirellula marina TaxID=124 RepID=A0A2S8GMF9_9BACT|nr:TlpA disulfide reductase family protein [Blastopirellula marina]PQO45605.1 hypothetical protein C5Y93_14290 [Blastopirellula marina]
MKFGHLLSWAIIFALGVSPTFADEPTTAEETPDVVSEFQPESAEAGLQQIEKYLRDPSNQSVPTPKRLENGIQMLDKLWEVDGEVDQKRKEIWMRFSLRMGLAGMGNEASIDALAAELEKAAQHSDPQVAAEASDASLALKLMLVRSKSPAERLALVKEKAEELQAMPISPLSAKLALTLVKNVSIVDNKDQAVLIADSLANHFAKSDDEAVNKLVEDMQGYTRRMNLAGNSMQVVGKTLDGKDLNWKSLKGKVVLVDFWATWCGPCIGEFPHMKEMYEAYHEHGFEIIGISLDDTKPIVEEFVTARSIPWTIVCNAEGEDYKGFADPNARYYGINAIPQMIFVGRDGIVIDTNARGERLTELLAEAFPDVEVPAKEEEAAESTSEQ